MDKEDGELSGFQSLPHTPRKTNSLNSTEDPFSFAMKNLRFSPSPVKSNEHEEAKSSLKTPPSFSQSAQEIQKRIHNSLISSLKLEQATMPKSPMKSDVSSAVENDSSKQLDDASLHSDIINLQFTPDKNRSSHADEIIEFKDSQSVSQFLANFSKPIPGESQENLQTDNFSPHMSHRKLNTDDLQIKSIHRSMEFAGETCDNMHLSIDHMASLRLLTMGVNLQEPINAKDEQLVTENNKNKTTQPQTTTNSRRAAKPLKRPPMNKMRKPINSKTKATTKQKPTTMDKSEKSEAKPVPPLPPTAVDSMNTIKSMEAVRDHLQDMLKMNSYMGNDSKMPKEHISPQANNETSNPVSLNILSAGDSVRLITSATSNLVSMVKGTKETLTDYSLAENNVDPGLMAEKLMLMKTLEKERYRRKHCEEQIQNLQSKVLETQQELAVLTSTTKKKDSMIEQLDKTLAQVVGGWKSYESNLVRTIQQLTSEKEMLKTEEQSHKKLASDLQTELSKVFDKLSHEQELLKLKEEEMQMLKQTFNIKVTEISHIIDQKNSSLEKLLLDKENCIREIKMLAKKSEEQEKNCKILEEELLKREAEYNENIATKLKTQMDQNEQLKNSLLAEQKRSTELENNLSAAHSDFNKLDELLGQVRHELEEARMKNSVDETKHSAAMKRLEAEQQISFEKKINERIMALHAEAQEKEDALREKHKSQINDLHESHITELERQCTNYEDRLNEKEKQCKQTIRDNEDRFNMLLSDRTETIKKQMMIKMQNLLQAHYNETLQLMGSSTGMTPAKPSSFDRLFNDNDVRQSSLFPSSSFSRTYTANHHDSIHKPAFSNSSFTTTFQPRENFQRLSAFDAFNPRSTSLHMTSGINEDSRVVQPTKMLDDTQTTVASEKPVTNLISQPRTAKTQNKYETEITLPTSGASIPAINSTNSSLIHMSDQEERKQSLQHYIEMLLNRAPGDPLNTSTLSNISSQQFANTPSTIASPSPTTKTTLVDNKENIPLFPARSRIIESEVALGLVNSLEKSLNEGTAGKKDPSPDIIPMKQNSKSAFLQTKLLDLAVDKNVHFEKTPQVSSKQTGKSPFTTKEVNEITDMLSSYTQNETPSGETREAAERLLSYLSDFRQSQRGSSQPTKNPNLNKSRSKSNPAWR